MAMAESNVTGKFEFVLEKLLTLAESDLANISNEAILIF